MNASIKTRVAVATLGLLGTIGLLAASASAQPSDAPSDQGTVVAGTARTTTDVATDGEVTCGAGTPATPAVNGSSDPTVIDTDFGPIYVGTVGNLRYIITSYEVIWGNA